MGFLVVLAAEVVAVLLAMVGAIAKPRARIRWLLLALVFAAAAIGTVRMIETGAQIVIDPTGHAAHVVFAPGDGGSEVDLLRLPFGIHYGAPPGDASLRVRCTGGRVLELGYVTPGMPQLFRLDPPLAC